jgi:hypothetical protein
MMTILLFDPVTDCAYAYMCIYTTLSQLNPQLFCVLGLSLAFDVFSQDFESLYIICLY